VEHYETPRQQYLALRKPQAKPYKLTDRDSMYLYVSIKATKKRKFVYRLDNKACTYTFGRFPDLSLHDAREL
jgi:hypothetical protein